MGSAGTGMFGTYKDNGAGSIVDGSSDNFVCPLEIELINLEDVANSDYYNNHGTIPNVGESVELVSNLVNKRLVVMLQNSQEIIGVLPVTYNYLLLCMNKGMNYSGNIISSGNTPLPFIVVNLHA